EPDTPTIDSQNEDAPELSLRHFLVVRPKKPSSELIESSTTAQPSPKDKSSISPSPTTQPDNLRKISTSSTVTEKDNINSSAVRLQNIEKKKSDSRMLMLPYGSGYTGGIETIPI
ncbi:9490_t:CDS:1, partial [Paraglomus occultum]